MKAKDGTKLSAVSETENRPPEKSAPHRGAAGVSGERVVVVSFGAPEETTTTTATRQSKRERRKKEKRFRRGKESERDIYVVLARRRGENALRAHPIRARVRSDVSGSDGRGEERDGARDGERERTRERRGRSTGGGVWRGRGKERVDESRTTTREGHLLPRESVRTVR